MQASLKKTLIIIIILNKTKVFTYNNHMLYVYCKIMNIKLKKNTLVYSLLFLAEPLATFAESAGAIEYTNCISAEG